MHRWMNLNEERVVQNCEAWSEGFVAQWPFDQRNAFVGIITVGTGEGLQKFDLWCSRCSAHAMDVLSQCRRNS